MEIIQLSQTFSNQMDEHFDKLFQYFCFIIYFQTLRAMWQCDPFFKGFLVIEQIGRGKTAQVFKVKDNQDGIYYAMKLIRDCFSSSIKAKRTYRQANYLRQIAHSTVVRLQKVQISQDGKNACLLYQYLPFKLQRNFLINLDEEKQIDLAYQLLLGLLHLKKLGIVHRDLQPNNIMVDSLGNLKFIDFQLSKYIGIKQHVPNIQTQNCLGAFAAPEVIMSGHHTFASDLWSAGCLIVFIFLKGVFIFQGNSIFQILSKQFQYLGCPDDKLLRKIGTRDSLNLMGLSMKQPAKGIKQLLKGVPISFRQILEKIFKLDSSARPNIQQLIRHSTLNHQFSCFIRQIKSRPEELQLTFSENLKYQTQLYIDHLTQMASQIFKNKNVQLFHKYPRKRKYVFKSPSQANSLLPSAQGQNKHRSAVLSRVQIFPTRIKKKSVRMKVGSKEKKVQLASQRKKMYAQFTRVVTKFTSLKL